MTCSSRPATRSLPRCGRPPESLGHTASPYARSKSGWRCYRRPALSRQCNGKRLWAAPSYPGLSKPSPSWARSAHSSDRGWRLPDNVPLPSVSRACPPGSHSTSSPLRSKAARPRASGSATIVRVSHSAAPTPGSRRSPRLPPETAA